MSLAISTSPSASSPSSTSTSPAPPATPLTPPVSSVNFNIPQQDQFGFDIDAAAALVNTPNGAQNTATAGGAVRRKPSRRANTAERRATHNAVERQRRETLNGRFLDLAALLPNLASVRRPSKSAIVNSSIALIHTMRRARSTAARELRLLKLESDQLRAEVNEWRERAGMGLGRAEEPIRSRDFEELVSGGLEESEEGLIEEERRALEIVKEGLRMDANGLGGSEALGGPFAYNMSGAGMGIYGGLGDDDEEDSSDSHSARVRPGSQGSSVNGAVPPLPMPLPVPRNAPVPQPMIFDPNSAFLQAHPTHNTAINGFSSYDMNGLNGLAPIPAALTQQSQDKLAAWNANVYGLQGQQNQYHPAMNVFTSPAAPHPVNSFVGYPTADDSDNTASSLGSDIHHAHAAHHLHAQMAHRTRSATSVPTLNKAGTPPSSAPPNATTYAEAGAAAGDAFAAAYGAYPKVGGGGNTYNAVMGLFM